MGELGKQRPKASHKVNNDKGSDSDKSSRGGVGTAASGPIDGCTKMANMRLFVSRTATRRGAARFITVTSSLVTDEEVDAATEGGGWQDSYSLSVYCMYHSLLCCMCWHRSLLSLLFDRERKFLHKHARL